MFSSKLMEKKGVDGLALRDIALVAKGQRWYRRESFPVRPQHAPW